MSHVTSTSGPVPVGPVFRALGVVVRIGVAVVGLLLVGTAVLRAWGLSMFSEAAAAGDSSSMQRYDDLDQFLKTVVPVLVLLTAIVWAAWQYRLAGSVRRSELTRSPGAHVWSIFVPVVFLWFPYQNLRDLWRAFSGLGGAWPVAWWWFGWTTYVVLDQMSARTPELASVDDLKVLAGLGLASAVFGIGTAGLALWLVGSLSRAATEAEVDTAGPE